MSEKILIVDDDIESLKLIGLMLQRQGYDVVAANSGMQALSRIRADRPDLIILDVMMPDMNGYEVCRRIRANADTRSIPILMFTAKTLIDDKVAGFEAGADDYLTKPTHPAELTARIKSMLARNVNNTVKPQNLGMAVGIIGARGGIGTSTLAVNFAAGCLKKGKNPIVADYHVGSGGVGFQLGITDSGGMLNLLKTPPGEIRPAVVEREIIGHESGLRALLTLPQPKDAMLSLPGDAAINTLQSLRALSDMVVLDLGSRYTMMTHKLISAVDRVIVFFDPSEQGLLLAENLIKNIKSENQRRLDAVVVNRAQAHPTMAWHEVEQRIGQALLSIVAYVPDLAQQALDVYQPIVSVKPTTIFANQMVKLAEDIYA